MNSILSHFDAAVFKGYFSEIFSNIILISLRWPVLLDRFNKNVVDISCFLRRAAAYNISYQFTFLLINLTVLGRVHIEQRARGSVVG
jgi:hypothetical protein